MYRSLALFFGIMLLVIGTFGLMSSFVVSGQMFGIVRVNFEHNVLNLASGILGILCALYSSYASKVYFIALGLSNIVLAAFGFMIGEGMVFGMIAVNMAANWIHAVVGIITLWIGLIKQVG